MSSQIFSEYKKLLKQFLSFRTVSTINSEIEVEKCVSWLEDVFNTNRFQVQIVRGYDNPVVLATKVVNPEFPTILVYGHYDVQPADIEEWGRDPFILKEDNKRLYGRGVVDNKGQMLVHLVNIFDLLKKNKLAYNIKFLIEGNEETGSPNIGRFIKDYKKQLESDFILVSDSVMVQNYPTIEVGLRGTFNTTLELRTSDKELHSGLFGGVAPNALHIASNLVSKLFKNENTIAYPKFYEKVPLPSTRISKHTKEVPFDLLSSLKLLGTKAILLEKKQNFYSQLGLRPTIQVTGLEGGYTKEGYRNSIPNKAIIKFNFRLVPNQDPEVILKDFKEYVKSFIPNYVDYEFSKPKDTEGSVKPVILSSDNKYIEAIKKIQQDIYKKNTLFTFNGATLPIIVFFKKTLKKDIGMVALANKDCNMHAVNENFDIKSLTLALEFSNKFFSLKI